MFFDLNLLTPELKGFWYQIDLTLIAYREIQYKNCHLAVNLVPIC
jgi:hypothetical protein